MLLWCVEISGCIQTDHSVIASITLVGFSCWFFFWRRILQQLAPRIVIRVFAAELHAQLSPKHVFSQVLFSQVLFSQVPRQPFAGWFGLDWERTGG